MEPLDQIPSDRSGATITDLAAIDLNHRDHFGGRTGQETLVRNENIMASQWYFLNLSLIHI